MSARPAGFEDSPGATRALTFSDDELTRIDEHAVGAGTSLWAGSSSH